jgi:hypothetical protein
MNAMKTMRIVKELQMRYATAADFVAIFTREMFSLFLLALILTADLEKAEKYFVSGFEE